MGSWKPGPGVRGKGKAAEDAEEAVEKEAEEAVEGVGPRSFVEDLVKTLIVELRTVGGR